MIDKVSLDYIDEYNHLGYTLNKNFSYLFNLEETINKPYNYIYGYYENDKLIGFIHILLTIDEADIVNIIVDDYYRKKGIGKKLIEYTIKKHHLKALK